MGLHPVDCWLLLSERQLHLTPALVGFPSPLTHFPPHGPMNCSMPGFPVHHQLPELAQTHVHQVGDAIQPSHSLSSPSPPAFNVSQHQSLFPMSQFFASCGQSTGVSASASVPSNEYSGLISYRIDWLDLLAVQWTL